MAALGVASLLPPAPAGAQPSLAFSTWVEGLPTTSVAGMGLGTGVVFDTRRAVMALDTRYTTAPWQLRSGRMISSWMLDAPGPVAPELVMVATHHTWPASLTHVRPEVRLHLSGQAFGAWVSAGAEAFVQSSTDEVSRRPMLGMGLWSRRRSLTISGVVEQNLGMLPRRAAPVALPDTQRATAELNPAATAAQEQVMLTTSYATVRWDGARVEFESVAGVTVSALTTPRRWAQASLAYRLTPRLAVVGTAGSRSPQYYAIDPSGERRTALSLRFSDWQSGAPRPTLAARAEVTECRLKGLGQGRYLIRVRAPGARRVEVTGDFTQWEPLALESVGGGWWELVLEMDAGIHQLNLRSDGGPWLPPPGFPTVTDGFAGETGTVVTE